jgi:signal peptidase I
MSAGAAIARSRLFADGDRVAPANPALAIIEKFRSQRSVFICVEGRSMWPSIRPRDIVFVQRAQMNQVSAGHIVAFAREDRVIIHRVLSKMQKSGTSNREEVLLTKGDALDGADFPVSSEELLGRVTRIHRGSRHIDLESLIHQSAGKLVALASPFSRFLYSPARHLQEFRRLFSTNA